MNRAHVVSAIGAVAFVFGGIIARQNAIEGVEKLEKTFNKNKKKPELEQSSVSE